MVFAQCYMAGIALPATRVLAFDMSMASHVNKLPAILGGSTPGLEKTGRHQISPSGPLRGSARDSTKVYLIK